MNNPRIGELAGLLLDLEDRGQRDTPRYAVIETEYLALKALPESWPDVRASKWTAEQRACALASGLVGPDGRSL